MPDRKSSKVDEKVELNMTPMIDVTFQLLIFFIITMKFRMLEKKLVSHLPTDFGIRTTESPDESFVVVRLRQRSDRPGRTLREQGTDYYLDQEKLELNAIEPRLAAFLAQIPDAKAKIDAGRGVPHQEVVRVFDLFSRLGYPTVSFVGLQRSSGPTSGGEAWARMKSELGQPLR